MITLKLFKKYDKQIRILLDRTVDLFFDRDIARLKVIKREVHKNYKKLDKVYDAW